MNYRNVRKIVRNSFKNVNCEIKEFENEDMSNYDAYLEGDFDIRIVKRGLLISLMDPKFVAGWLYFVPAYKLSRKESVRLNHKVLCIYEHFGSMHDHIYGVFDEKELEKNIPGFLEYAINSFTTEQELENMVNSQEYQNYLNHTNL